MVQAIEEQVELGVCGVEEYSLLDAECMPAHVAIVMDGNRRWAKKHGLAPILGHWEGAETITKIVRAASHLGIKTLTVYTFSTENWGRSCEEVEALMHLFRTYLVRLREMMLKEGVRLEAIGDLSRLPVEVRNELEESRAITRHNDKITLVLALNYGARDEIRRAAAAIAKDCVDGKLDPAKLSEKIFSNYLDTAPYGDPQLLIRTSGEKRLSNFLLWQISYAEVYITETLWPDFSERELIHALIDYQKRERRLGRN